MNLILFNNYKDIKTILENKITGKKNEILPLNNWRDFDFSKYDSVYLFAVIVNNFVDFETQEFILQCKKKINIITVSARNYREESFISWVNSLICDFKLDLNICAKTLYSNLSENLQLINGVINNKVSKLPKNSVTIYTDGACSGNPGAGGWGVILMDSNRKKEFSGYDPMTTNNKMELTAVVKALSLLKKKCNVELFSDSAYVVNAITQNWLLNWKTNGWKNSDKEPVKNMELWQELDNLLSYHNVTFNKVKGHSDNEFNNRCDFLATEEIKNHSNETK